MARRGAERDAGLFVLLASLAFATSGPLARFARPAHPLVLAFGRVGLAALFLFGLDARGVFRSVRAITVRERGIIAGAGVLLAAHFGLFLWGLDRTSLPAAIALVSLEPLSVILCAWAIHGVRPTRLEQLGVLVAGIGVALVASAREMGEHRLVGDLLVVGSVALYGFYVSAARELGDSIRARHAAPVVYACAAIVLFAALLVMPSAAAGAPDTRVLWPLPSHSLGAIAMLALVPTVLGHTLVQSAARRLSPSVVALASPGETFGGIVIGAVLLGALPTAREIVGALIMVGGSTIAIVGSNSGRSRLGGYTAS